MNKCIKTIVFFVVITLFVAIIFSNKRATTEFLESFDFGIHTGNKIIKQVTN